MKLSSAAVLLSAAVAALPGASAATVSLRGILPENEILADFANCCDKNSCSTYGQNTCMNLQDDCGACSWNGSSCRSGNRSGCGGNGGGGGNKNDCRDIFNRSDCLDEDCQWVGSNSNGECRIPSVSFRCSDFDNSSRNQCEDEGCSWNSSSKNCRLVCRDFDGSNRNTCERSGYCDWDSNNGSCDIRSCRDLDDTSRNECQDNDVCTWNNSNRSCRFSSSSGNRNCNSNTTRNQCLKNNCDWRSGQCRIPFTRCSDYNGNKSQCKNKGCSWNSNSRICSTFRFNTSEEEQKEE